MLRSGSYFPDWPLEGRRRAERALTTVVATCYLLVASKRRMEKLVETLGITRLSKSRSWWQQSWSRDVGPEPEDNGPSRVSR